MKNYHIISCTLLLLLLSACTNISVSKSEYISTYESWVEQLKSNYKNYNESDWAKVEKEFNAYNQQEYNKYKDQLTDSERMKVDNLTGQYYAVFAKYQGIRIKQEMKSIFNEVDGMVKELQKK